MLSLSACSRQHTTRSAFSAAKLVGLVAFLLSLTCHSAYPQEIPPTESPIPEELVVQEIRFVGNTVVDETVLRTAVGITPGVPFGYAQLANAVRRIEEAYTERGYLTAFVYYELQGEPPSRALVFNIRESRIAEVRVAGLERTRENIVRRFIEVRPGDVYSQRAIQQDILRLNQLHLFEEIQVLLEPAAQEGEVVLTYQFIEAKTRRIDLGGSYSPEGRLILQVQYTDANLGGRAQQLIVAANIGSIQGKLGGQVAYINPLVGGRPGNALQARVYSDVIFRFGEDLVEAPGVDRYFERRTGVQAMYTRQTAMTQTVAYGVRYENTEVGNFPEEFTTGTDFSPDGAVLLPSARYARDERMYLLLPASGRYFSAQIEAGPSWPDRGREGIIAKVRAERSWYFPLQRVTEHQMLAQNPAPIRTFALRVRAGTSAGDLPFFEHYFVGGVFDLRGYRESRFWGRHFVTANAELRWPVSNRLVGLAFVDAGDAWGTDFVFSSGAATDFEQHRDFSLRLGAGFGLWYVTEFGVVRLEFARGEANRIHFAVGETF